MIDELVLVVCLPLFQKFLNEILGRSGASLSLKVGFLEGLTSRVCILDLCIECLEDLGFACKLYILVRIVFVYISDGLLLDSQLLVELTERLVLGVFELHLISQSMQFLLQLKVLL